MRTVSFSDARGNLKQVLDRVVDDSDVTIITRRDAEDVVVMSLSTWNSWRETEYLLASPANARRLRESIAQLNAGKGVARELIGSGAPAELKEPHAPRYRTGKPARKSNPARPRGKKRG